MKKIRLNKILSITFFAISTLLAGMFYGVSLLHNFSTVKAVAYDPRTNSINFKLNQVSRVATAFDTSTDTYSYNTGGTYIPQDSNIFEDGISDNEYFMLNNYSARENLKSGTGAQSVKNIYLGFGSTYNEVFESLSQHQSYGDRGKLVDVTNVSAQLNGQDIQVANTKDDEVSSLPGLEGQHSVRYWYQYLDLTNVRTFSTVPEFDGLPITETSGLYTFNFIFNVFDYKNGAWSVESTQRTFSISFYLLNQSDYAYTDSYPMISPATKGNPTNQSHTLQYFYNYTEKENATIKYDASLYNISFLREKSPLKEFTESEFKIVNNVGVITYRTYLETATGRTLINTTTKNLSVTDNNHYFEELELPELGSYDITIRYTVKTNLGFKVIEHSDIPAYNLRVDRQQYENNTYAKGKYQLHVFGVKAYFVKNGQTLDFENRSENTVSNITPYVGAVNSVSSGYAAGLGNQIKYPTTNLPPVFFDYYATYNVENSVNTNRMYRYTNGFTKEVNGQTVANTPTTERPVTKDTQISDAGYYEIVFNYSFNQYSVGKDQDDNDIYTSDTEHFQVFAFRINSTTPNVSLRATEDQTNQSISNDELLTSKTFTNKNVYAMWNSHNYFTSVITATLTRHGFNGQLQETIALNSGNLLTTDYQNINRTLTPMFKSEGKYTLKVYYSENTNLHAMYEFIIDKTPIKDINIHGIDKVENSTDYYIVNDNQIVALQNSLLINQPFTLSYSLKESGAVIKTQYIKVPFKAYLNASQSVSNFEDYVLTNFQISPNDVTSKLDYNFNYTNFLSGKVTFANAFDDNNSFVYIFTITDEAGNTAVKNVIFDITTPQVIVTPLPDNPYNVITENTKVFWGTHKAVFVAGGANLTSNHPLKNIIESNLFNATTQTGLFREIAGNYYMLVPITNAIITSDTTGQTRNYNRTGVNIVKSALFAPKATSLQTDSFFVGEDSFVYKITDASNLRSSTTIKNNNQYINNIMINHDNALAFAYGKSFNANYGDNVSYEYGEALNWNYRVTNADQLRVTYLPGEPNTGYFVKSFSYKFYPKDISAFTSIGDATTSNTTFEPNEIRPFFPYSYTPSFNEFRPVTISNLQIPGQTEGNKLRLVSDVINKVPGQMQDMTEEGLYVFRREYNKSDDESLYEDDSVIRYYYIVVDREQNINILGSSSDIDISNKDNLQNINANNILYQTGSGIYFKFTNNSQDNVRKSAKQIQQEKNQTNITNMFQTNKLPVRFNLPEYKFNDEYVLKNANDYSENYTSYLNSVLANNIAPLYYIITLRVDGRPVKIVDTFNRDITTANLGYHPTYVTRQKNSITGANELLLKQAGVYDVELISTKSAEQNVSKTFHNMTSYKFSFTIVHESPTGNYVSQVEENTFANLQVKKEDIKKVNFISTNNKDLKFVFEDNADEFKARIDYNNLTISRKNKAGQTTIIYSKVNGQENFPTLSQTPTKPTVFSRTLKDSLRNLYTYTLDINFFINQPEFYDFATYTVNIHYIGNRADYQINTLDYYSRDFEIIVDREKPKYNLELLNNIDALKYNKNNVSALNNQNYFYAINKDFNFIRNANYGGELDSNELFVRPLQEDVNTNFPINYLYSITPDTTTSQNTDAHPKFSDTDPTYHKFTYDSSQELGVHKNAEAMLSLLQQTYNTSYFEIIERDEANNYSVYAVRYTYDKVSPIISLSYSPIGSPNLINDELSINKSETTVNGRNLKITNIQTEDYFVKAEITHNNQTKVVYNNPYLNNSPNSLTNFINNVHDELAFTNIVNQNGYSVTIVLVNRFGDNQKINYLVPGDVLKPKFDNIGNSSFKVTIPTANESTRITELKVWKFENGAWSSNHLITDSLGNFIRPGEPNGPSLGGDTYEFSVGEYKFQLIDNFGRGYDIPYYYGIGVINNVNTINYGGKEKVVNNKIYTAGPVNMKYQVNLYELKLYKYELDQAGQMQEYLITNIDNEPGITITDTTNGVRNIEFKLSAKNSQKGYRANLLFYRTNTITNYEFILYTHLPNITLTTRSGSTLNPASSPFTENVLLTWSQNQLDFNSTVNLTRTFMGTDGKIQTTQMANVQSGYEVSLPGSYTATITNSLGYTDSAKTVRFQLIEGQVVVYDVTTIDNGYEKLVNSSPITSFVTVGSENKILHKYYILSKYKGNISGYSYQIRLNTDKNLSHEIYETRDNSVVYKIFGNGSFGYERFIEIVFVEPTSAQSDFTELEVLVPVIDAETGFNGEHTSITPANDIRTNSEYVLVNFKSFTEISPDSNDKGNIIYAEYFFNNVFVERIYNLEAKLNSIKLTNSGIHSFKFYDLAGNQKTFNGNEFMNITLLNNVLFTANGQEPINNIIVNNQMDIDIISRATHDLSNKELYAGEIRVTATLDGKAVDVYKVGTQGYKYRFTKQGYYEVTMSTSVSINNQIIPIETKYNFTIISTDQKLIAFNLPSNYEFTVKSIIYQDTNLDTINDKNVEGLTDLWLAPSEGTLSGKYDITLRTYQESLKTYKEFSFTVFIHDELPEIYASIHFGSSTTKPITISFAPLIIYNAIGQSTVIVRTDGGTLIDRYDINENADNTTVDIRISAYATYWVELYSKDGKLILSNKLIINEPLNATATIVISIVSVLLVGMIVAFIIIRRRLKFR